MEIVLFILPMLPRWCMGIGLRMGIWAIRAFALSAERRQTKSLEHDTAPTAAQEWTVNDMYESPIKLLVADIHHQIMELQENEVYKAVLHYVPDIDKAELIRALQYDREQYNKGYADGKADAMADLVRCKDCKRLMFSDCYGECGAGHYGIVRPNHYCSYGERKDGDV
jgi:hypothetical protein